MDSRDRSSDLDLEEEPNLETKEEIEYKNFCRSLPKYMTWMKKNYHNYEREDANEFEYRFECNELYMTIYEAEMNLRKLQYLEEKKFGKIITVN